MTKLSLSRRSLIAAAAAIPAAGTLPHFASAQTAQPMNRPPFFYNFKLGELQGTVASDGTISPLGKVVDLYAAADKEELQQLLTEAYIDEQIALEQNVLVLKA